MRGTSDLVRTAPPSRGLTEYTTLWYGNEREAARDGGVGWWVGPTWRLGTTTPVLVVSLRQVRTPPEFSFLFDSTLCPGPSGGVHVAKYPAAVSSWRVTSRRSSLCVTARSLAPFEDFHAAKEGTNYLFFFFWWEGPNGPTPHGSHTPLSPTLRCTCRCWTLPAPTTRYRSSREMAL